MIDSKILISAMARRCGLQDPDAFALAGGAMAKTSWGMAAMESPYGKPLPPPKDIDHALRRRGTGRTTRMLLEALVALQCGCKVDIETYDEGIVPDLGLALVTLCVAGRIDMATFHYSIRTSDDPPLADALRLSDHFVAEMAAKSVVTGETEEACRIDECPLCETDDESA